MSTRRKLRLISIVFISAIFLTLSKTWVYCGTSPPEKQVEKLLSAVQKKDFKTIFDISYYYQMELSQIRSKNPKVLWQKLTTEYYESKKKAFLEQDREDIVKSVERFGEAMFGFLTDPADHIRALMNVLKESSKWKIIESKREKHFDQFHGREYDVFVVYTSLSYRTVEESPLIDSKFLKEAILGFMMDAKTGLYMRSARIGKGDVYWGGDPSTDFLIAKSLAKYGLWDDSIKILEDLEKRGILGKEGKGLLASTYFYRVDKSKGFVRYTGDFYGLNDWRPDIEKAIALDRSQNLIREMWVKLLASYMRLNLKSNFGQYSRGEEIVNEIAKAATEFSRGFPELEKLVYKPKLDLANIYIHWAKHDKNLQFISKYLRYALELLPNDPSIKHSSKEILKTIIDIEVKKAATQPSFVFMELHYMMEVLEVFDSLRLSLDPLDIPLFIKAAGLASKKYRTMIGKKERAIYWEEKAKEWTRDTSKQLQPTSSPKLDKFALYQTLSESMGRKEWDKVAKIVKENIEQVITLSRDEDDQVRLIATGALGKADDRAVDPLITALKDKDPGVRHNAAFALGEIGDKRGVDALVNTALRDGEQRVRYCAINALEKIGDRRAVEILVEALKDNDAPVRYCAVTALYKIGDSGAVGPLIDALKDEHGMVRGNAASALGRIGDKRSVGPLIDGLKDEEARARQGCAYALGKIGDKRAVEPLILVLKDRNKVVRASAAVALREIGDKRAIKPLTHLLTDEDEGVRRIAEGALQKLGWSPP